ncbi:hypothetical protein KKF63_01765 [bacterium]|nr:hypothetical protein [bacterium]
MVDKAQQAKSVIFPVYEGAGLAYDIARFSVEYNQDKKWTDLTLPPMNLARPEHELAPEAAAVGAFLELSQMGLRGVMRPTYVFNPPKLYSDNEVTTRDYPQLQTGMFNRLTGSLGTDWMVRQALGNTYMYNRAEFSDEPFNSSMAYAYGAMFYLNAISTPLEMQATQNIGNKGVGCTDGAINDIKCLFNFETYEEAQEFCNAEQPVNGGQDLATYDDEYTQEEWDALNAEWENKFLELSAVNRSLYTFGQGSRLTTMINSSLGGFQALELYDGRPSAGTIAFAISVPITQFALAHKRAKEQGEPRNAEGKIVPMSTENAVLTLSAHTLGGLQASFIEDKEVLRAVGAMNGMAIDWYSPQVHRQLYAVSLDTGASQVAPLINVVMPVLEGGQHLSGGFRYGAALDDASTPGEKVMLHGTAALYGGIYLGRTIEAGQAEPQVWANFGINTGVFGVSTLVGYLTRNTPFGRVMNGELVGDRPGGLASLRITGGPNGTTGLGIAGEF